MPAGSRSESEARIAVLDRNSWEAHPFFRIPLLAMARRRLTGPR